MDIQTLQTLDKNIDHINNFLTSITIKCKQSETDLVLLALADEWLRLAKDAIILLKTGNSIGHVCIIREMFEVLVYISYITQEKSDFRALCYLYFTHTEDIRFAKMKLSDTDEHRMLINIDPSLSFLADEDDRERITSEIEKKQKEIDGPRYEIVRQSIGRKEKAWYTVNANINTLKDLARAVNMEALYVTLYSIYSCHTHGNRAARNFFVTDTGINDIPFKSLLIKIIGYYSSQIDLRNDIKVHLLETGVIKDMGYK